MWSKLEPAIKGYADNIRLEVTKELLSEFFYLEDGTEINWGSASIDDHNKSYQLLSEGIKQNSYDAARHLAAVSLLEETNASCLKELET